MKHLYIAAGAVAVFLLWNKGQKAKKTDNQLQDTLASQQGSDWIGAGGLFAMWDRLSGADLVAPGYPNIAPGPVADPGKVGQLQTGMVPGWNGTLG